MTDSEPGGAGHMPTPSVFMRGRRPSLYSDSVVDSTEPLSRAEFEYRLDTITARSEEAQFQRFVHALLEVEVCPNLIPQTGPTGGGDSKVDTETYAVADGIADRWWSGIARKAANDSWAFAISAMKDWRTKARRDIDSVLASGRSYDRIYFVTNQFVKDKDRAKLEGELTKRAGKIPVRIFDRTWIVQAVYDHEHWPIAERELSLPSARARSAGTIGPIDADRSRQLAQVEAELNDSARFANSPMQLAHAWLTSALLARGLGRPRDEIDQRFDRAIAAARESASARGQRRMIYQKAWTAFWWFDDYTAVIGAYDAIDALLDDDSNAWDLEQLTNLYTILNAAERNGWLPAGTASLDARHARLYERLEPMAKRRSHPTDAAWARTHLLHLDLLGDPRNPEQQAATVKGLRALLRDIEHLPEYPVEALCGVIAAFTELPFTIEGLDAVADQAGELTGRRIGAQAQARLLLDRATRKVANQVPEEALRLMGRAFALLHKQPSRELYLEGAWIAAQAYCDVGLFCAARAHLLQGFNRSLRSMVEHAEISGESLNFALRLAWVELAAGRLPLMLEALNYADLVAGALDLSEKSKAAYFSERQDMESLLARAIAGSEASDAEAIRIAPAILSQRQLRVAEQVSLALLGYPQDSLQAMAGVDLADIQAIEWPKDLGVIDWRADANGTVRSQILGCELIATGVVTQEARALVMGLFAVLEGFAATAFADRLTPATDRLMIIVDDTQRSDSLTAAVDEDECGEPVVHLGFARGTLSQFTTTARFHNQAINAIANIIGHVFTPRASADIERMFSQDAVHDRAFGLLHACALDDNSTQPPTLAALLPADAAPVDVVDDGRFSTRVPPAAARGMWDGKVQAGQPLSDNLQFHHRRTRLLGAIYNPLWNRAGWHGVGFLQEADGVPELHLMFTNSDAAGKILRGWRRRIEGQDADQILRVAILTDVDRNHRAHYTVGIGPAEAGVEGDATETILLAVRLNTMTPDSSTNLDNFLAAFAHHGRFRLGVAVPRNDPYLPFAPLGIEPIELTRLETKAAWQIAEGESMLGMLVRPDDDPFIPDVISDPRSLPVMQFIDIKRRRSRR